MPTLINDPNINFDHVRQVNFNRQVNKFLNTDLLGLSGPIQVSSGVLYGYTQSYDFGNQDLTNCGDGYFNNDDSVSESKVVIDNDLNGTAATNCQVKLNSVGDSFGAVGTQSNSDFLVYAYGAANSSMYFSASTGSIYPLSSGTVSWGTSGQKWGTAYFTNMYLNNDSTATFFELTSGSTTCRFESFGTAAYSGFGTTTAHNLIIFTSGAGGGSLWLDTSKNVYPHNTGTSLGTLAAPWENIRGNNWNPEGGQLNFGGSAAGASVLEIGNSSSAGQVTAIDLNFGTSSAVDYNYRILNGADEQLSFTQRTGATILQLNSAFSYFSNQLSVGTTTNIDSNIELCVDGSTIGYPLLLQQYGNSNLNILARGSRGTEGTPTAVQSGDSLTTWDTRGYNGSAFSGTQALWKFSASQTWTGSANGTQFSIGVTPNDSTSIATALVVGNDGDMTLGGTEKTGTYDIYAANFYQNSSIGNLTKTKKVTIGYNGSGADFEFTAAADTTEQNLSLTNLLPAFAQLVSAIIVSTENISVGITSLNLALGTTSSGEEIITAGDNDTLNDILESSGSVPIVATTATLRNIYLQGNIVGANWSTLSAGQWYVNLTYTDNAGI
jgi:hypothetical protein